jgi:ankyrin repeat protein
MLRYGADPNDGGDRGLSPLIVASAEGHVNIVRKLIEYGANSTTVTTTVCENRTSLHEATENGHTDVCRALIAEGCANPYAADSDGSTPVSIATSMGRGDIVDLLTSTHPRDDKVPLKTRDLYPLKPPVNGSFKAYNILPDPSTLAA